MVKPPAFSQLLRAAQEGDIQAKNELFELIDRDLRSTAKRMLDKKNEKDHRPTSLVNEAYLRLFKEGRKQDLKGRQYFFGAMIKQMHYVLTERYRVAGRRPPQSPLDQLADSVLAQFEERLPFSYNELRDALKRLKRSRDPRKARRHQMLEYFYIAGMSIREAATHLEISPAQAQRDKTLADIELYSDIMAKQA